MRLGSLLSVSCVIALPLTIFGQTGIPEAATKPIPVTSSTTSLSLTEVDAEGAEVPDALVEVPAAPVDAEAAQAPTPEQVAAPTLAGATPAGEIAGLTREAELDDDKVYVIGASWLRAEAAVVVEVRTESDGEWTDWGALELEDPVEGGEVADTRTGTAPLVVVGADRAQARIVDADGNAPTDARLDVVDPGESDADDSVGAPTAGAASADVARPTVYSRAQWGADERLRSGTPNYGQVKAAVVHHTAGTNDYTAAQVPAIIRGMYSYHTRTLGWDDIGYNMVVDRFGRAWEGRAGGIDKAVTGAHVSGYNSTTFGISVMGCFQTTGTACQVLGVTPTSPPAAAVDTVTKAIAWKLQLHGVNANARTTLNGRSMPTIVGHSDLAPKACPGNSFLSKLPAMRSSAAALQARYPVVPKFRPAVVDRDLTGDNKPDLVSTTPSGASLLAGRTDPFLSGRTAVGAGWSAMTLMLHSPDLTGDGKPDLLSRDRSGLLRIHHGDGRGATSATTVVGGGWDVMSQIIAPGDFSVDRKSDLVAVEARTGRLWLYPGNGRGGFTSRIAIGNGWDTIRHVVGTASMNGDPYPDLIAVDTAGRLLIYPGNGRGGFGSKAVIGSGWGRFDRVVAAGDLDNDGTPDLLARDAASGRLFAAYSQGTTFPRTSYFGAGWTSMPMMTGGVDWDGDGDTDVLASDSSGRLYLYRGAGRRDFERPLSAALPEAGVTARFVIGDVDGNGRADVVSRTSDGALHLSLFTGTGQVESTRQVGSGWNSMSIVTGAADMDSNGVPDIVALQAGTGNLYLYRVQRNGSISAAALIGTGFGSMTSITGVGAWTSGSTADLLTRTASGDLYYYKGKGTARLSSGGKIGHGWQGMSELLAAGDITGDGHGDLVARQRTTGAVMLYPGNGRGGVMAPQVLGVDVPTSGELS